MDLQHFSLLQRAINFHQNSHQFTSHTLIMLLHYLGKLKTICTDICLETLSTLTAIDQCRKHLQACVHANSGHFEHLLWTNWCKQFVYTRVFDSIGICPWCQDFLLCWCLMVNRPTLFNCKALSLLRTVNKQKVECWYLHSVNLCALSWHLTDICWIDDKM